MLSSAVITVKSSATAVAMFDEDYFERLFEEIREIRLSERRFYQKITDIYATAMDYDKNSPTTRKFSTCKIGNRRYAAMASQCSSPAAYKV